MSGNSKNISDVNRTAIDLVQDPFFTLIGKDTNLSSYWNDPKKSFRFVYLRFELERWMD